jgi:hypothetical protein
VAELPLTTARYFPAATEHTVVLTPLLWYDRRRTLITGRVLLAGWVETQRGFPMRLPRMTMRRWMIAVAIAGVLLGTAVWGRRLKQQRDYYLKQANFHARLERFFRSVEKMFPTRVASGGRSLKDVSGMMVRSGFVPALVVVGEHTYLAGGLARHHAELKEKYLHFASRPWLSVPADPPL